MSNNSSPGTALSAANLLGQPRTRQDLYDQIRQTSKDEFIIDEMVRLGFWSQGTGLPNDPSDEIKREAQLAREMRALRSEKSRLYNEAALLKEMRKQRLLASREKKKATKERRLAAREAKRQAWKEKQALEITYLGEGVSGGLNESECDIPRLQANGLPLLKDGLEIATAMNISVGDLRFLSFARRTSKVTHYQRFKIAKKTGGFRTISAPMPRLKAAQHFVLEEVLNKVTVSDAAHGFRKDHSIVSNARPHVGKQLVINMDLENFFPTITYPRVRGMFRALGYSENASTIFSLLTTEPEMAEVELDGASYFVAKGKRHLPQGAPSSPQITNILCRRFDKRIKTCAQKLGFVYTRYADDLTFSTDADLGSEKDAMKNAGSLLRMVRHIVEHEGFKVHPDKTRVMHRGRRQEVTGVVVNDKLGVAKKTLKNLRAALHHIDNKGLAGSRFMSADYDKGHDVMAVLLGYANFARMVDSEKGAKLLSEAKRVAVKVGYVPERILPKAKPVASAPATSSPATTAPAPAKDAAAKPEDPKDDPPKKKKWKLW